MRSLLPARADRLGGFLDFLYGARGECHCRTGICQGGGGRKANTAAGTGHQRALAIESKGRGASEINCHASSCPALGPAFGRPKHMPCAGHPRLPAVALSKTWMTRTSPAMKENHSAA